MEKKNKSELLVGILIGLVIALLIGVCLFLTETIKLNNKKTTNNQKETLEKEKTNTKNETDNTKNETDKYTAIIEEYKNAMNDTDYKTNQENYKNINRIMMNYYHSYKDKAFKYTYLDINNDKKTELIIGDGTIIYEIYTYGDKAERFINSDCLGDRCSAIIYDNGIIYFHGSGGANYHGLEFYKIASDGYSKDIIKEYTAEYKDNSVTITDETNKKVTDYKDTEEVISNEVGNAKEFDLSKLKWTEIK